MILQRTPDGIIAIKQEDHAALAAFFLEHWSDHNFAHDPERGQIILATREHDNGWGAFDADPALDETTGLPLDFRSMSPEATFEIWRRATAKYIESDPFVALLITHHGYSLHEQEHKRHPAWKAFFTEFAQLRAELRNRLGLTQPDVERAYSYVRMMDWFSLAYCMHHELGQEKPDQYAGYNYRRTGHEFLFRPYPFDAKGLRHELPIYPLRPEGYATQSELAAAFATPVMYEVLLNPLGRTR
jgi:hypothetical protein